jgi:hypothetical protein
VRRVLTGAVLALLMLGGSTAHAATPAAAWSIVSIPYPTDFAAAHDALCESEGPDFAIHLCDTYGVTATDIGAKATGGS